MACRPASQHPRRWRRRSAKGPRPLDEFPTAKRRRTDNISGPASPTAAAVAGISSVNSASSGSTGGGGNIVPLPPGTAAVRAQQGVCTGAPVQLQVPKFLQQEPAPTEDDMQVAAKGAKHIWFPELTAPLCYGRESGGKWKGLYIDCTSRQSRVGWAKAQTAGPPRGSSHRLLPEGPPRVLPEGLPRWVLPE